MRAARLDEIHARWATAERGGGVLNTAAESAASTLGHRGAVRWLRDYGRRLRMSADSELAGLGKELNPSWDLPLVSVGLALLLVLILHGVTSVLLDARNIALQTVALLPVGALAFALVAVLIWAYRHTKRGSTETSPYAVGLLASVVTIGVAAQAFAALNVYLAERGVVPSSPPSLLSAEALYAWHLLDAVPFLDVTQTLGWSEPRVLQDSASGTLLLAFKIAVIGPFIRLVLSSYHLLEKLRASGAEEGARLERFARRITARAATIIFVLSVPALAALYKGCTLAFDGGSRPNRWLGEHVPAALELPSFRVPIPGADRVDDRLPEHLDVPSLGVALSWAATAPQWVVVALLLLPVAAVFVLALQWDVRAAAAGRWWMIGPLGAYVCLALVVTALWSSLTLTLLHSGLVTANQPVAVDHEFRSTTAYYLWHASDVIPAVDLPRTLHWSLGYEYVDGASAGLLLVYKLAFLLILAFPLMRVVRSGEPASDAATPARSPIVAAHDFAATLRRVERDLDDAHALTLALLPPKPKPARRRRTPAPEPRRPRPGKPIAETMLPKISAADNAATAATRRIQELEAELAVLHPLTSGTDLADAAAAAVTAAGRRSATIAALVDSARSGRHVRRDEGAVVLDASRSMLAATANSYRRTALRVLGTTGAGGRAARLPPSLYSSRSGGRRRAR